MSTITPPATSNHHTPPPYSPSNYEQRPNETGTLTVKPPSPANDGTRAFAIWDAPALMRRQANFALEAVERSPAQAYSPDALWGLADKIQELNGRAQARDEFRQLLDTHRNGVSSALQRYSAFSAEEVREHVAHNPRLPGAHPRLLGISGADIQNAIANYYDFGSQAARGLADYSDTFQTVGLMMHVVAFREDQAARVASYRT